MLDDRCLGENFVECIEHATESRIVGCQGIGEDVVLLLVVGCEGVGRERVFLADVQRQGEMAHKSTNIACRAADAARANTNDDEDQFLDSDLLEHPSTKKGRNHLPWSYQLLKK